jgi:hypothetical protein
MDTKSNLIYICGDSFGVPDDEYIGVSWPEKLSVLLGDVATVNNLSMVAASNLLINLQVEYAIQQKPNFIIVLCTSVTRDEVTYNNNKQHEALLDRFYRFDTLNNMDKDLVSYSLNTPHHAPFSKDQLSTLNQYKQSFFDLDLNIFKNKCIIENTLQKLVDSKIPFLFDQGGFEHKSYSNVTTYFQQYSKYKSALNLWDYAASRKLRPYFHIDDPAAHKQISEYYALQICKTMNK